MSTADAIGALLLVLLALSITLYSIRKFAK